MERLSKSVTVLRASLRLSETNHPNSRKQGRFEKERNLLTDCTDTIIYSDVKRDSYYYEVFSELMKTVFCFINHKNADLRLVAEQCLDSMLQHLISQSNISRAVVLLMSEVKRNGAARSLAVAISRMAEVIKYVKATHNGAIGVHLLIALIPILRRPEETVQAAIEKYVPSILTIIGHELPSKCDTSAVALYEVALENLELSGTSNRVASVIIWQLAMYMDTIRFKVVERLPRYFQESDEPGFNINILVGTLTTLRLVWPVVMEYKNDLKKWMQVVMRNVLRCVYSKRNEVIVASLECLEKMLKQLDEYGDLIAEFYPQSVTLPSTSGAATSTFLEQDLIQTQLLTNVSEALSVELNSIRGVSPFESSLDTTLTTADNDIDRASATWTDPDVPLNIYVDSTDGEVSVSSSCHEDEIIDPLRHLDIFDDEPVESMSERRPDSGLRTPQSINSMSSNDSSTNSIAPTLPTDISSEPFAVYTSVLIAKRFLLSGKCLKMRSDCEVRVSHKILAMNCLAYLAAHLTDFFEIPLSEDGGVGVQRLKDIELFIGHEDDQLKAATITTIIAAFNKHSSAEPSSFFKKCVLECVHMRRAQCIRALFSALKSSIHIVYTNKLIDRLCEFACEYYRDHYFLLRISVVEFLASIEWRKAESSWKQLPGHLIDIYLCLLSDHDHRVRKIAAENLPLLVKNANFNKYPDIFVTQLPSNFLCDTFPRRPLIIGLGIQYNFGTEQMDFNLAENLSVILHKVFELLLSSNDENCQTGLIAGLMSLSRKYSPSCYQQAWLSGANNELARIGSIQSLLDKALTSCASVQTIANIAEICSSLFAAFTDQGTIQCAKAVAVDIPHTSLPKLPPADIINQLLTLSLRILNLYYTVVMDRRTERLTQLYGSGSSSSISSGGVSQWSSSPLSLSAMTNRILNRYTSASSPLRKQLSTAASNLIQTSFLLSTNLKYCYDSMRGAYVNYLSSLNSDVRKRFSSLLIAALNSLSCVLEMTLFPSIQHLVEELVLYCHIVVEFAPVETIRLVTQIIKTLFGRNAANLSITMLRRMLLVEVNYEPPHDILEAYLLKSANLFTEFVVNSGKNEYFKAHLLRNVGWLRKDTTWKAHCSEVSLVAQHIEHFEEFVSMSMRFYQASNSCDVQIAILNLLCELVRNGINFTLIDPETRLLNLITSQLNEMTKRVWCNEAMESDEGRLMRSIFEFLSVLSHIRSQGQTIIDANKVISFSEVLLSAAADSKPHLAAHALNCLQVVLTDYIGVRCRFEIGLVKILTDAANLWKQKPTELVQLWTLLLYGASTLADEQTWCKVSLSFYEMLLNRVDECSEWSLRTTFSVSIALRSCHSIVFRPIDRFYGILLTLLQRTEWSARQRTICVAPFIFIWLCVLDEDQIFSRLEQLGYKPADEIARLLIDLLWAFVRELNESESEWKRDETESILTWYLHILSYALRSGSGMKTCSLLGKYSKDVTDMTAAVVTLPNNYPKACAHLIGFLSALVIDPDEVFSFDHECDMKKFLTAVRRTSVLEEGNGNIVEVLSTVERCSLAQYERIVQHLDSSNYLKSAMMYECENVLKILVERACFFESSSKLLELVDMVERSGRVSENVMVMLCACSAISLAVNERVDDFVGTLLRKIRVRQADMYVNNRISRCQRNKLLKKAIPKSIDPATFDSSVLITLLMSSIKSKDNVIQAESVSKIFSTLNTESSEQLLLTSFKSNRFDILSCCLDELQSIKVAALNCGEMYSEYSMMQLQRADSLLSVFIRLCFDIKLNSPLQLSTLSKIANQRSAKISQKLADWASDGKIFNHWMKRYVHYLGVEAMHCNEVDECCIDGMTFAITQPSFINEIESQLNSKEIIQKQLSLVMALNRLIDLLLMSEESRGEHNRRETKICEPLEKLISEISIHNRTGQKNFNLAFFSDATQKAFDAVLKLQEVFRNGLLSGHKLSKALEKLAKGVTRLPFLNDISCIPRLALSCGWHIELEVYSKSITIPTVNIHYLANVDVLKQFTWRISWAGWNRRVNFDNFSMSLFGVLGSTPTGSELNNPAVNVTERVMASSAAVEGLTNLLLQSLLYPERGNPVNSRFIMKHRDLSSSQFLSSAYGKRMCMLKALLLGVYSNAERVYGSNLEFLEELHDLNEYRMGHLSVHSIWNMTGVLDQERNLYMDISSYANAVIDFSQSQQVNYQPPQQSLPSSTSNYLLESGHDSSTESCLRTLFDTYSHWFRVGIDALPLSLLCGTVKSMTLLSDLFTDLDQFKFLFGHMKTLFNARSYYENFDIGSVILSLLKCVAVLGIEEVSMSKADAQKMLFSWVECGLTLNMCEMRVRTLQGLLFVLQSINHDDLKPVLVFLHSFIINELQLSNHKLYHNTPNNTSNNFKREQSNEYEILLWTVGFFFCANALFSTEAFKVTFVDLIRSSLIAPQTPDWLMNLLTTGIEHLVISTRIYIRSFDRIAIQMLTNYFQMPSKFIYSLRIFIVCLYHGMQQGAFSRQAVEQYDPRLYLMEQHKTLFKIVAEGDEKDAKRLTRLLPYLLIDTLNQSEIINSVLKELIHLYPNGRHPRPFAIFSIIHQWFSVLHRRETDAVVIDWTLNSIKSFKYVTDPELFRFYASAFLCSSSPNPDVSNLFHMIIGQQPNTKLVNKLWFGFAVRSFCERLDAKSIKDFKYSMMTFIKDGVEMVDPQRIRGFPLDLCS